VDDWRARRGPPEYGDEGTEGVMTRFARWLAVRRMGEAHADVRAVVGLGGVIRKEVLK
jgi:hypothetical protein